MNRENNDWTFKFYQKAVVFYFQCLMHNPHTLSLSHTQDLMCENAPDQTAVVEACRNSSYCVKASGNLNVTKGMQSVTVTFTNLEENSKYKASVHVQYNGGVVHQSQPVEISKFCYNNYTQILLYNYA